MKQDNPWTNGEHLSHWSNEPEVVWVCDEDSLSSLSHAQTTSDDSLNEFWNEDREENRWRVARGGTGWFEGAN